MGRFNLNQILSDTSKAAAGGGSAKPRPSESRYEKLSVFDLVPSEDNFYSMREIGELKAAIEIAGKVLQILFNLVTQAEKQFGSGTGSLKYAAVADWIYQRIPAVLKLLFTSSDIEKMIEAALEEAKKAWGANENLKGYIDTPSVESLLVGIEEQAVQTEPAEN